MLSDEFPARQERVRPTARAGSPAWAAGQLRLFFLLGGFALAGCTGPNLPADAKGEGWEGHLAKGAERSVEADWDDIDAAVMVGASRVEMAIVAANSGPGWDGSGGDPRQRVFELKTVRDEPAWLVIWRGTVVRSGADGDRSERSSVLSMQRVNGKGEPETFEMRAKVGRFGDKEHEEALLRAVANRLDELKGVETFPVDR